MRLGLLTSGVVAASLALVAVACSDQTSEGASNPNNDGGSKRDAGPSGGDPDPDPDAGDEDSGPNGKPKLTPKELKAGQILTLGLIGDEAIYVLFGTNGATLESVPIAGGASTKIADIGAADPLPFLSGGAIAIYTNPNGERATLSIWTKATGTKPNVATDSAVERFAATEDGSRVAFSVDAAVNTDGKLTTTNYAVTSAADPSPTPVLTGKAASQTGINLAAENCKPDIAFVGKTLIGAYCTGTGVGTTSAKLFKVDDGAATPNRLDAATNTAGGTIEPYWLTDTTGSKVIVFGTDASGKLVDVANDTLTTFDTGVDSYNAFITKDGSSIVYMKGDALMKATTAAAPVKTTLVATGVKATHGRSDDDKRVLYSLLDPEGDEETVDLRGLDFTTDPPAPVDYVTTATTSPVGFNATSSHVLYLSDFGAKGAKVKSQAAAGGTEKVIGSDAVGAFVPPTGSGTVLATGLKEVAINGQTRLVLDLGHVDTVSGGTLAPISSDVAIEENRPQVFFKAKRMVFVRLLQGAGSGLYSVELP